MNSDIEEGIGKGTMKKETEETPSTDKIEETPPQMVMANSPSSVGNAWASDAIKEALGKPTPEECKFYLDSLREMSLSLLGNECFNAGMGFGKTNVNHNPAWSEKRCNVAISNIAQALVSRVNALMKLGREGKLTKLDAGTQPPTTLAEVKEKSALKVVE